MYWQLSAWKSVSYSLALKLSSWTAFYCGLWLSSSPWGALGLPPGHSVRSQSWTFLSYHPAVSCKLGLGGQVVSVFADTPGPWNLVFAWWLFFVHPQCSQGWLAGQVQYLLEIMIQMGFEYILITLCGTSRMYCGKLLEICGPFTVKVALRMFWNSWLVQW